MFRHSPLDRRSTPFSVWLSAACEEKGVSLKLVSAFTHVPYGYLKLLAKGEAEPAAETVAALESFFGPIPQSALSAVNVGSLRQEGSPQYELPNPFAKWLLDARSRIRLTQAALGRVTGIGTNRICSFETGAGRPNADELRSLIGFLGPVSSNAGRLLEAQPAPGDTLRRTVNARLTPFGRIIRSMRRERGMSLTELSRRINPNFRSNQPARDIEYGVRTVTPELLQTLADIFTDGRIPPSWRCALEEGASPQETDETQTVDDDLPPLGRRLRKLRRAWIGSRLTFAELTGMTLREVQDIEFGRRLLTDRDLGILAQALGFEAPPPEWFELRKASGQEPPKPTFKRLASGLSPFGSLLREERKRAGVTQKMLCEHLGVRSTFLHEVEHGLASLTPLQCEQLAKRLGRETVPEEWLSLLQECGQLRREA